MSVRVNSHLLLSEYNTLCVYGVSDSPGSLNTLGQYNTLCVYGVLSEHAGPYGMWIWHVYGVSYSLNTLGHMACDRSLCFRQNIFGKTAMETEQDQISAKMRKTALEV